MSNPADPVRIDDLTDPQHPAFILDAFKMVADNPASLTKDAVLTAAREQSGLDDFGDPEFEQRLELLLQCMRDDRELSPMGQATNFNILVRYAAQRAHLFDLYRRHPEIDEIKIKQPIVIAGLPRSGTTHMLNLISVDKRLRSLQYWESLEPFPRADEQVAAGAEDPRIQRCRDQLVMQDQIMPYFKNMHEMYAEHIHEEIELMGMDFSMMLFENYGLLPAWRDYFVSHDQTPHYEFLKKAMKALQWLRGPERWIMKSPQHMEQLVPLTKVFPDATFVLPHRDPVSVTTSLLTMLTYSSRMSRDPVKPEDIGYYWADRVERMLSACVRDYDALPPEQTIEVMFHEFMQDDIATVERIYDLAGHPMTAEVKSAMQQYMVDNPRGKYGRVQYDLKGDFGLDRDALYERYRFYTDRFAVKIEAK